MKVFLSYSTPTRCDQRTLFYEVEKTLKKYGASVKTVANVQSTENPISTIIKAIKDCDCLLCLAFEKYRSVENGQLIYHTSSWLDIEIALALQQSMPILVLKEQHIGNSPLIDCCICPYKVLNIETYFCNGSFEINNMEFERNIIPAVKLWIDQQVRV